MAKTGIDLSSYRLSIGVWAMSATFGRRRRCFRLRRFTSSASTGISTAFVVVLLVFLLLRAEALPRHGDVERNPGPTSTTVDSVAGSDLNLTPCGLHHPVA